MIHIQAKFDGKRIVLPPDLPLREPADVVIVFDAPAAATPDAPIGSIWDFSGKSPAPRTRAEIREELAEIKGAWERDESFPRG